MHGTFIPWSWTSYNEIIHSLAGNFLIKRAREKVSEGVTFERKVRPRSTSAPPPRRWAPVSRGTRDLFAPRNTFTWTSFSPARVADRENLETCSNPAELLIGPRELRQQLLATTHCAPNTSFFGLQRVKRGWRGSSLLAPWGANLFTATISLPAATSRCFNGCKFFSTSTSAPRFDCLFFLANGGL